MNLTLWRWSTTVQVTSALIVALFFGVLVRSIDNRATRWWVLAWLANLGALGIALCYWYFQPAGIVFVFVRIGYFFTKASFAALLIIGAWAFRDAEPRRIGAVFASLAAYALLGAWVFDTISALGVAQHVLMAVLFGVAGVLLARSRAVGLAWLSIGFLVRSVLATIEAFAYSLAFFPRWTIASHPAAAVFLSVHSSFDSIAEWFLTLGCVLALSETIQQELRRSNAELVSARDEMQRLADHDPLTGLLNRRALPAIFHTIHDQGGMILFFDLDGFKAINDRYGHQTGDDCLQRFATLLRETFAGDVSIVRYAGDEFVVVTSNTDRDDLARRVEALRQRAGRGGDEPHLGFSVGITSLDPRGNPEAALSAADSAMYEQKKFLADAAIN